MLTIKDTVKIIKENDLSGFTVAVKGELKRYVVANTHNEFDSIEWDSIVEWVSNIEDIAITLTKQANENMYVWQNVTIWGWRDDKTDKIYIDAGMSTDDLEYAINCGKYTKQIAIWDNVEQKEIRL